jgi:hypothetical protein
MVKDHRTNVEVHNVDKVSKVALMSLLKLRKAYKYTFSGGCNLFITDYNR